jgi:hypothetical protein
MKTPQGVREWSQALFTTSFYTQIHNNCNKNMLEQASYFDAAQQLGISFI